MRHTLLLVLAVLAADPSPAFQRAEPADAATAAKPAPAPGFVADLLKDFGGPSKRLVQLADAMPGAKFTWRPVEGVRSFSQVLMHVAAGNFLGASSLGVPPPAGLDPMQLEEITDKERVVAVLRQSIAAFEGAVAAVSEDALEGEVVLFDDKLSRRVMILFMQRHFHEHAGQAIAYARMAGVVPPWSRGSDGD